MSKPEPPKSSFDDVQTDPSKGTVEEVNELRSLLTRIGDLIAISLKSTQFKDFFKEAQKIFPNLGRVDLDAWAIKVKSFFSLMVHSLTGFIAMVVLIGATSGMFEDNYIFRDFHVPASFIELGITEDVLKKKLIDAANTLPEELAKEEGEIGEIFAQFNDQANIDEGLEIMDVSLTELKGILRSALGIKNYYISGHLIGNTDSLAFELSIQSSKKEVEEDVKSGKIGVYKYGTKNCEQTLIASLDSLVKQSAYHILSLREPLFVAISYKKNGEFEKAKDLFEKVLKDVAPDEEKSQKEKKEEVQGYQMWGEILLNEAHLKTEGKKKYLVEAKERFLHVAQLDSLYQDTALNEIFATSWSNLGDTEYEILSLSQKNPEKESKLMGHRKYNQKKNDRHRKEDSLQLKKIMGYYEASSKRNPAIQHSNPYYEVYYKLHKKVDTSYARLFLQELFHSSESLGVHHFDTLMSKISLYQEDHDFLMIFYRQYLDLVYKQASTGNAADSLLLSQSLLTEHPFLKIFQSVQDMYYDEPIDTFRYYEILERLAYFDWEYDFFSRLSPIKQLEKNKVKGPLCDLEFERDTTDIDWSYLSITPLPSLGKKLSPSAEIFWYYMTQNYEYEDYKIGSLNAETLEEKINTFITDSTMSMGSYYLEWHNFNYPDWFENRTGIDWNSVKNNPNPWREAQKNHTP